MNKQASHTLSIGGMKEDYVTADPTDIEVIETNRLETALKYLNLAIG